MVVPFDISTVLGWYIRLFVIYAYGGYTYALTFSAVVSYLTSCCLYVEACCEHFESMLQKCDELIDFAEEDLMKKRFTDQLKTAVSLHTKILELVETN